MTVITSLVKVSATKAVTVCQDIELEAQALSFLTLESLTVDFLNALLAAALYPDAIKFLARALPKREAVWWACLCARSSLPENVDKKVLDALEAAEKWVYNQTEEDRRFANTVAHAATFNHPASWAAIGAFWSTGSIAPVDVPTVPPADNLTSKAVAGAIMLASVIKQPEKAQVRYQFFMEQGIDIANGGYGRVLQDF